jgi:hypothetical protein
MRIHMLLLTKRPKLLTHDRNVALHRDGRHTA